MPGLQPAADSGYKTLIVSGTHGLRPTQVRLARVRELASELAARRVTVHLLILAEQPLQPVEEEQVLALRECCHEIEVVSHPANDSLLYRTCVRSARLLPAALTDRLARAGGEQHCPRRLLRILHSRYRPRNYAVVLACGAHLARALDPFSRWSLRVIDLPRVASAAHASHRHAGRGEALREFSDPRRELRLLRKADAVLVRCGADAVELRSLGFDRELILVPQLSTVTGSRPRGEPTRPPRLLFVGSETTANLDGLRWLRGHIWPRVLHSVPTCRLRVVGESARHLEPEDGVDRIGWVDDLAAEYDAASVVVLPLRMGSGLRRRALDALAAGRVLAATATGAYGLPLVDGTNAVLGEDQDTLADGIVRVLTDDALRASMEARALALSRAELEPERALGSLCRTLGVPLALREERAEEPVLA